MRLISMCAILFFCAIANGQDFKLNPALEGYKDCVSSKNQGDCIDSLIIIYEKFLNHPKANKPRVFKRLIQYYIQASLIHYSKENYSSTFLSINQAKQTYDSLKVHSKTLEAKDNFSAMLYYYKKNYCYYLYKKDTSIFFQCDCKRFFPELDEVDLPVEMESDSQPKPKQKYGDFYTDSGLLILDQKFKIDTSNLAFLKINKSQILHQLKEYNKKTSLHLEQSVADTCIIKLTLKFEQNKLTKQSEIMKSIDDNGIDRYLLNFVNGLDLWILEENTTIYLPIIIRTTATDHLLSFNRCVLGKDHFLIECEKIKPVKPN